MARIRVLLCALALFAGGVAGCACEDCEYGEVKYPAYANKSGIEVKIVAIKESYAGMYEKFIVDGDTSHYSGEECAAREWLCIVR